MKLRRLGYIPILLVILSAIFITRHPLIDNILAGLGLLGMLATIGVIIYSTHKER